MISQQVLGKFGREREGECGKVGGREPPAKADNSLLSDSNRQPHAYNANAFDHCSLGSEQLRFGGRAVQINTQARV